MLSCKKTYNIYSIKNEWIELQNKGALNTPFQEYEYVKRAWKLFYPYYLTRKCLACFYSFYEDGHCVMILPVVHYLISRKAELLLCVNGLNYCDVLALDESYVKLALAMMSKEYDSLRCSNVLENSLLFSALKDRLSSDYIENNVCIHFGEDYDAYNKSLSKSVRQNLRTAYNRLSTDNKALEFRVLMGGVIGVMRHSSICTAKGMS